MALRADDVDLGRDRTLVERFQAGDQRAFDDLYSRYFDRLTRFCARRVNNDRALAEEIAQEAFYKALLALPRLQGDRRFYPWVTVIASRLCTDHHRKAWRTELADEVDLGAAPDTTGDRIDEAVDLAYLHQAMQQLAPRHREVLEMREREGLTNVEIGVKMDVKPNAVDALLHRARKALRREFAAVAGEGFAGRLAGVPLLGWASLKVDRLRLRAQEVTPFAQQMAMGALGVAVAASPVLIDLPAPGGAASTPTVVAAAASAVTSNTPDASEAVVVEAPVGTEQRSVSAARGADVVDEPDPTPTYRVTVRKPRINDPDQPKGAQPVGVGVGPLRVEGDPAEIVDDVTNKPFELVQGESR